MPTLADYIAAYTRKPTATVKLNGQTCYGVLSLRRSQTFGAGISTGTIVLRDPPVTPTIGMSVSWKWGYNGQETDGFTGEIAKPARKSYPNRYTLECRDALWRADRSNQVIATDPLNEITASAAIRYILTHYGGIPSSKISIPTFSASGSKWAGSEWTLGVETPVQWGDPETESGGTTALKAAQDICSVLGYWLYADASGIIRAKQMERAPSLSAFHVYQRGVDLLTEGSPELQEDVDSIANRVIIKGANTGVEGAQIGDTYQTSHPLLPAGVYQEYTFSSFLIEYVNAAEAGAASATEIAKRILKVRSRTPVVVRHRVKADPRLSVGATVGIIDSAIGYSTARNFFVYQLDTSLDLQSGAFDQQLTLDGGTGNSGYTTIPPPDASFSWRLITETLDADAVVEVILDGSGSTSLSGGEIVSWDWSTSTTTYGSTPDTATGETAVFLFLASEGTAEITLTVTDTTSKTGTITQTIDLTGADTQPPIRRPLSVAFGAAWQVTPDGGANWRTETSNGDAIAVGTIGAGVDARARGLGGTYGVLATRGSGGVGIRQSLDLLATASTNGVSAGGAITSNIWVNEANPARVWFAVGTAVYRSTDGGLTKTAMAAAPATVTWIMEDPAVDNSVFLLAGADLLNATDPTLGWAVLYPGPVGATARQFVRSRDGQVTWVAYTGAPAGESLQRVENGAAADWTSTDCRTLALDNEATSLKATIWGVTADDPAQIWSFDGLTGLGATQATPTLPSGATAMHMLADPDAPIYYIADFDSVASGTGAVRKFLADQLFLYKAGATGQQAHMLGLAAKATAPAEFLRMTTATDPAGVWHYGQDAVWVFRPLPVSGTVHGVAIVADPFNASRWLSVWNNTDLACYDAGGVIHGHDWAYSPVWYTEDAGVTWTEVVIATPGGWVDGSLCVTATFNDLVGNSWLVPFGSGGTPYTAAVLGTGATVTTTLEDTTGTALEARGGADGEWLLDVSLSSGVDGIRYIDTGNVQHTPTGGPPADLVSSSFDRLPGLSRAVFISDNTIYATTDYRAAQPTSLLASVSALYVTAGLAALYYVKTGGDLWRIVDPLGAATATQIGFAGAATAPRVDRQTRTIMGCGGNTSISVDDGVTTRAIANPPGSLSSAVGGAPYSFEVMVRTT